MKQAFEFRAWHKDKKYMYYNVAIGIEGKVGYRMAPSLKKGGYVYEDNKEIIVNPYIGGKDKGREKIFIGDILEVNKKKHLGIVVWDNKRLCYKLETKGGKTRRGLEDPKKRKGMKIVGNIYENEDLLEEKTS